MADPVARMIAHADLQPGDMAVVHVHDPLVVGAPRAVVHSSAVTQDALPAALARLLDGATDVVVTPDRAIGAYEARLEREQLAGWLREADESAGLERGAGLLLGYDPLDPERTLPAAAVAIADDEVTLDGATLFRWADVARASACRGSDTASYHLVDGRSVFLHAAVDWPNRLS